jgi:hypothetical protein
MQTRNNICHCIVPKMLTSCPCDSGLLKNVISQSDHSTHATCNVRHAMLHARLRMTVRLKR